MIDFHTHILPGMDDGSKSLEESRQMLLLSREQGIERICATSHFYRHRESIEEFLSRRALAHAALAEACGDLPLPTLELGAEVAFYHEMNKSHALKKLAIGHSDCVLIEMPFSAWTTGTLNEIYSLANNLLLTPILAHVERYSDFFQGGNKLNELLAMGAWLQINAEAILSRRTRNDALAILQSGRCLLGSDCHNLQGRAPNMREAVKIIEKSLGKERSHALLCLGKNLLG